MAVYMHGVPVNVMVSIMQCEHPECKELAMSGYGRDGFYNMGYRYCTTCRYYTLETINNCPGCNNPYRLNPVYAPKIQKVICNRI